MKWVIAKLESLLRRERMIGTRHDPLQGDAKYKISSEFSKDRIPQLQQAIQVLKAYKSQPTVEVKKSQPKRSITEYTSQLNLFKNK